jgi:hypothetical protein
MATALVTPLTGTGVDESAVVPLPNPPSRLKPQHLTVPFATSAHECAPPVAIATTLPSPFTATGIDEFVVVPSPS